ncbi:unnamed protein product [Tenebrio molitor]|nr:unnamed protein product [Tenebrio molitor]
MFLHEHNLAFNLMEHMPQLIKSVCPDSEVAKHLKISRTKATEVTKVIKDESVELIVNSLKGKVYSLIMDETTDLSTQKSLVVLIRYYDDKRQEIRDAFLGLIRLLRCNAESSGGVQARFQEINPSIFVLGCTCHSMHLCASAAACKLPKSVEEFVRNIYNHFSNSSNRAERLEEFQHFLNMKPAKMLHPSQTRWLSLQAVVNRVLESWDALKLYFTGAVLQDNLRNTQHILEAFNTPVVKLYLLFLSYILDIVNRINIEFQSEQPKIHQLLTRIKELYRTILRNY